MPKINGNEINTLLLKASDGSSSTLTIEDSGSSGTDLGMEHLTVYLSVDDGEWIDMTKSVNWEKLVTNFNKATLEYDTFTNIGGKSDKPSWLLLFDPFEFTKGPHFNYSQSSSSPYSITPRWGLLSAADQSGTATIRKLTTNATLSNQKSTLNWKEIIWSCTFTLKSDEDTPIDKIGILQGTYSNHLLSGWFDLNTPINVVNEESHAIKFKVTW